MRCTSPRTVGFKADGKTIAWSPRHRSKEYAEFQLPCSKCLECRLEYGRQWAIRCVHEAQMHERSCFITLTYETLTSPKLDYSDFQSFMKRLREEVFLSYLGEQGITNHEYKRKWSKDDRKRFLEIHRPELEARRIGVFVTGEYGEKTKRPHWHALIFGWSPSDGVHKYTSDRGDKVSNSDTLTRLWQHGIAEYGQVSFHSAGYCARYAAKKLVHGNDQDHDFHPISKKSSKQAIGKSWLEKFWPDVFNHGVLVLPDGSQCGIPRYYEKWLKEHQPREWLRYISQVKLDRTLAASEKAKIENEAFQNQRIERSAVGNFLPQRSPNEVRRILTESKFKLLQMHLKL